MTPPVAFLAATVLAVALVLVLRWLARPSPRPRRRDPGPNWIAVDGSNVMYWDAANPRIETVRAVTDDLRRRGFVPVVWFDANAGHLTLGRWAGPDRLALKLGLPPAQVHVVGRGTQADPAIIAGAEAMGAHIVTNDRYRDWQAADPTLQLAGVLVSGGVREGRVRLEFPR